MRPIFNWAKFVNTQNPTHQSSGITNILIFKLTETTHKHTVSTAFQINHKKRIEKVRTAHANCQPSMSNNINIMP